MAEEWRQMWKTEQWMQIVRTADPELRPYSRRAATDTVPPFLRDVKDAAGAAIMYLNVAHAKLARRLRDRRILTSAADAPGVPAGEPVDFLDGARKAIDSLFADHVRADRVLAEYLAHHAGRIVWSGDQELCAWGSHHAAAARHADGALCWVGSATASAKAAEDAIEALRGQQFATQRLDEFIKARDAHLQRAIDDVVVACRELGGLLLEIQMERDHYQGIMRRFGTLGNVA